MKPSRLSRVVSLDHKVIGLQYLWLGLIGLFAGGALAILIRYSLANPAQPVPLASAPWREPAQAPAARAQAVAPVRARAGAPRQAPPAARLRRRAGGPWPAGAAAGAGLRA